MTLKTALVTGAASGIGAAVVRAAARQGANVAAVDVDIDGLERVAADAAKAGTSHVLALEADVRSEQALQGALQDCLDRLGVPTDVLANAGIELSAAAHVQPLVAWNKTLEVNLTGAFLTARYAIGAMLEGGFRGSVVCTSSPSAFVGFAGGENAAYAASKGGISAMVRSLALDYASVGIRVNGVVPGPIDTPLLTAAVAPQDRGQSRDRIIQLAQEQVPLGRLGTPDEVANAVLWLWSDAASYVTGSHLVVDGGLLAKSANTF